MTSTSTPRPSQNVNLNPKALTHLLEKYICSKTRPVGPATPKSHPPNSTPQNQAPLQVSIQTMVCEALFSNNVELLPYRGEYPCTSGVFPGRKLALERFHTSPVRARWLVRTDGPPGFIRACGTCITRPQIPKFQTLKISRNAGEHPDDGVRSALLGKRRAPPPYSNATP